jgi:hypothetical protein
MKQTLAPVIQTVGFCRQGMPVARHAADPDSDEPI